MIPLGTTKDGGQSLVENSCSMPLLVPVDIRGGFCSYFRPRRQKPINPDSKVEPRLKNVKCKKPPTLPVSSSDRRWSTPLRPCHSCERAPSASMGSSQLGRMHNYLCSRFRARSWTTYTSPASGMAVHTVLASMYLSFRKKAS